VETIPVDGKLLMPSAISVRKDGTILVGQSAKVRVMLDPEHSVVSAKRQIGNEQTQWQIFNQTYTPVDVSKLLLSHLKEAAQKHLGGAVTEAIITVPAYFNNNQKRATKLAGEAAGFKVLRLLPEPTAAAISYGLDQGKDQTILVYDLGGGTFDVSILSVHNNKFEVIAVDGDSLLGGDDFDNLLVEYLIEILQQKTRTSLDPLIELVRKGLGLGKQAASREMLAARQRLKEAAEKAKIELSETSAATISLPEILGASLEEEITLAQYNRMISPLVDRTIAKVLQLLTAANLEVDDIDRVILVGGSTRNKLVIQKVTDTIKQPWIFDRVDEAVAQGAAIVAHQESSQQSLLPDEDFTPIEFKDVTPFDLGVRTSKGQEQDLFQVIIPRNRAIPSTIEHEFTTWQNNQKAVSIAVFQGESQYCAGNTFIGGFQLRGLPPLPKGEPKIIVKFEMDSSDLLKVSATCRHLRSEQVLDVNLVSREEEIQPQVQADIMFLVDTSGSMSDELEGVKSSCLDFADRIIAEGIDCRVGLMDFDKEAGVHDYKWEIFKPMSPANFPQAIAKLKIGRLGGCGCSIGNPATLRVMEAFANSFPSSDRLKIGILISDEVGNDANTVKAISQVLQQNDVCLYALGVPDSCHGKLAAEAGGKFWDIFATRGSCNFAGLLDQIAVEITSLALR
jgi:molecular chaperone DnaK